MSEDDCIFWTLKCLFVYCLFRAFISGMMVFLLFQKNRCKCLPLQWHRFSVAVLWLVDKKSEADYVIVSSGLVVAIYYVTVIRDSSSLWTPLCKLLTFEWRTFVITNVQRTFNWACLLLFAQVNSATPRVRAGYFPVHRCSWYLCSFNFLKLVNRLSK